MRNIFPRVTAFVVVLTLTISVGLPQRLYAAPLTSRSVTIGSSLPGASTTHEFDFTLASISAIGSIEFEYCENDPFVGQPCTAPTGFSASSAVLQAQTGEIGFTISPLSTNNRILLTRTSTATSAIPVSYTFDDIVNHTTANFPVYVRVATFATEDGTGGRTDEGAVAYSTASAVSVEGYVPPYIIFCVGVVVALNCTSSSGVLLNFGELSQNQPRFLTSQFSVATNDPGGYSTTLKGTTMTSGNNTIPAMDPPAANSPGSSQFGINLRANTNPSVGANPTGVGSGAIAAGFNTPNQYYFRNQVIASSVKSTDFNRYTVSYLVNVGGNQRPGIYSTTLTYIASAAF